MTLTEYMPSPELRPVAHVSGRTAVPLAQAWDRFVPIDLTALFMGMGPLPAVVKVHGQSGRWDKIGESRQVDLSDGTTVTEAITLSDLPKDGMARFGYTVFGFGGAFGWLTSEAQGFWVFKEVDGQTEIGWRYGFRATSILSRPIMVLILLLAWRPYMRRAMQETLHILQTEEEGLVT